MYVQNRTALALLERTGRLAGTVSDDKGAAGLAAGSMLGRAARHQVLERCDVMRLFDRPISLFGSLAQPLGCATSSAALRQMKGASRLIFVDGEQSSRSNRMAWAKERWLVARPGREVLVTRCGAGQELGHWLAIFLEDDQGIVSARGMTAEEALAQGFAILAAVKRT